MSAPNAHHFTQQRYNEELECLRRNINILQMLLDKGVNAEGFFTEDHARYVGHANRAIEQAILLGTGVVCPEIRKYRADDGVEHWVEGNPSKLLQINANQRLHQVQESEEQAILATEASPRALKPYHLELKSRIQNRERREEYFSSEMNNFLIRNRFIPDENSTGSRSQDEAFGNNSDGS